MGCAVLALFGTPQKLHTLSLSAVRISKHSVLSQLKKEGKCDIVLATTAPECGNSAKRMELYFDFCQMDT